MQLRFLGTRGGIVLASRRHRRHSALLVEHARGRLVIDCGEDWRGRIAALAPDAILVTHAHPDHCGALADGAPCPVYASPRACRALARFPIELHPLAGSARIAGLAIEAFPVVHSVLAPAVGFRIDGRVVYVPDVLDLRAKRAALGGIALYIGDGARIVRPLVRTHRGRRFGHTSISTQLGWCARAGVTRAMFTHCGTEVVRDHVAAAARVRALGDERGVHASIASDGLVVEL